jgi:hypothetical protein
MSDLVAEQRHAIAVHEAGHTVVAPSPCSPRYVVAPRHLIRPEPGVRCRLPWSDTSHGGF